MDCSLTVDAERCLISLLRDVEHAKTTKLFPKIKAFVEKNS